MQSETLTNLDTFLDTRKLHGNGFFNETDFTEQMQELKY